ncbi:MAG: NAD(+) diphosphatase [Peptostreptococcaceae bacterium]|jgi:NAD+ diphosphatase|nr:NAD(+) diphosphatase [Peptostreptococcaceae bacterium]
MFQKNLEFDMDITYKNEVIKEDDYVLMFSKKGGYLRYKKEDKLFYTLRELQSKLEYKREEFLYGFKVFSKRYYIYSKDVDITKDFEEIRSFKFLTHMDSDDAYILMNASHVFLWNKKSRYCGVCGSKLDIKTDERAKICKSCNAIFYPQIAPSVIVGVENNDRLLLTKYNGRAFKNYALVAGFIEIGETVEQAVRREVKEEVGVNIKDISYFKSQPWGKSNGLLMGYYAKLDGSDIINLDEEELSEARWMTKEEIRSLDINQKSLTGTMIKTWLNK